MKDKDLTPAQRKTKHAYYWRGVLISFILLALMYAISSLKSTHMTDVKQPRGTPIQKQK